MILFLVLITFVSSIAEQTVIVHQKHPLERITIEWTITEKLAISIPVFHEKVQNKTIEPTESPTAEEPTVIPDNSNSTSTESPAEGVTTEWTTTTEEMGYFNCSDSQGRDFFFILDGTIKQDTMLELMGGFIDLIEPWNSRNRIRIYTVNGGVVFGNNNTNNFNLDDDTRKIEKKDIMKALRRVVPPSMYYLHNGMQFLNDRIRSLKDSYPDRVIIMLVGGFDYSFKSRKRRDVKCEDMAGLEPGSKCLSHRDVKEIEGLQEEAAYYRSMLTENNGTKLFLVAVGQSKLPYYEYFATEEETVKIESNQNFSLYPVEEFARRFFVKSNEADETKQDNDITNAKKFCGRKLANETMNEPVYPKCEGSSNGGKDFIILLDKAGLNFKEQILNLTRGFIDLINPWSGDNRLELASYGKDFEPLMGFGNESSKKEVLNGIGKLEYEDGSDITWALAQSEKNGFNKSWKDKTRERIVIIIASSEPSAEAVSEKHHERPCYMRNRNWLECLQYGTARSKGALTRIYGAKILLITIGDFPMHLLKFVAPEKDIVKIESFENFPLEPIEELKRRFCL